MLSKRANPTLRDHGRGLRAEQWARFCGRYVCAEVIERFARHRLLERTTSCRWGSEPELAAKVLQGKVTPIPTTPLPTSSTGLKSRIRKVFRTSSGPDRSSFSLVSQLTSAALCASSPALPKNGQVPPVVKSLLRPLSVPQLRYELIINVLNRSLRCGLRHSLKIFCGMINWMEMLELRFTSISKSAKTRSHIVLERLNIYPESNDAEESRLANCPNECLLLMNDVKLLLSTCGMKLLYGLL
ncbi:hypothetical protein HZH68_011276 [Vespula germanica]|uniref:Uncharacterized protein n=1 Tax=Vespula germanica TaxID=30212 RepID=A0A834JN52_VESGE|nr:hypothetical protein HZH68_011276 [Vespula germanica]